MKLKGVEKEEFALRLKWLIIARVILYTIALAITYIYITKEAISLNPLFLYTNIVIYITSLISYIFLIKRRHLLFISYFSFVVDLFAITLTMHLNGGLAAPLFPIPHLLLILATCIHISLKAGVVMAFMASLLLTLLVALEYHNIFPPIPFKGIGLVLYQDLDYVILVVVCKIIFFFGAAIIVGYLSDRTKRQAEEIQEREEQLIQAERMTAIANISTETAHEIRNPLGVIKTGLFYLKKTLPKEEKTQRKISQIDKATDRVSLYIDNLLSFSRPTKLNLKEVQINNVLENSFNELPAYVFTDIKIEKYLDENIPLIEADSDRLFQVFSNIIKNGCEAMQVKEISRPAKADVSKLEIKSKNEDNFVKIEISDAGHGIKEKDLKHIFDPFFTTKGKGVGLGLTICQHIIEAHKGEIDVKSNVGVGTTFIIKLPYLLNYSK
ncbi:MAG: ATP-binding protein [bacterium]|nr:ATP-binding protein [bacterium]